MRHWIGCTDWSKNEFNIAYKGMGAPYFYFTPPSLLNNSSTVPRFYFWKKGSNSLFQILVLYIPNDEKREWVLNLNSRVIFVQVNAGHSTLRSSSACCVRQGLISTVQARECLVNCWAVTYLSSDQFGLVDRATNFGASRLKLRFGKLPSGTPFMTQLKDTFWLKKEKHKSKLKRNYEWANIFRNRQVLDLRL